MGGVVTHRTQRKECRNLLAARSLRGRLGYTGRGVRENPQGMSDNFLKKKRDDLGVLKRSIGGTYLRNLGGGNINLDYPRRPAPHRGGTIQRLKDADKEYQ